MHPESPISRRQFVSAAAGLSLAAAVVPAALHAAGDAPVSMNSSMPKLVHHVFFWLKNPDSKEDLNQLLAGIRSLAAIETVRGLHVGVPASTEKRPVVDNSYSASEMLLFDSVEDQNVYQVHPLHEKFVREYSHLWSKVVVYDSIAV